MKSVGQILGTAGILSPIGLQDDKEMTEKSGGYDEVDNSGNLENEEVGNDKNIKPKTAQKLSAFARRKQFKKGQNNEGKWIVVRKRKANEIKHPQSCKKKI